MNDFQLYQDSTFHHFDTIEVTCDLKKNPLTGKKKHGGCEYKKSVDSIKVRGFLVKIRNSKENKFKSGLVFFKRTDNKWSLSFFNRDKPIHTLRIVLTEKTKAV